MAETLYQVTLQIALSKVGVHETTENWGPEIKKFLAAANIKTPAPWCAGFVNWCAEQAAIQLAFLRSPLEVVPLQGYVQSYVDHGKKNGWVVPFEQAMPGDLFCVWHKSLNRYGHIGLVTSVNKAARQFGTVEGNSNNDGSREGVEVVKHVRQATSNILILRWGK